MSAAEAAGWSGGNQRSLAAHVERIRALLERHVAREKGKRPSVLVEVEPAPDPVDDAKPPAIDLLTQAFGLSPFERRVLLLCAAVELDAKVGRLCAALQGDPRLPAATFGLALAVLPEAHWSALAFDAPLRHHRLVEVLPGPSLTASPLRIDERVLHYLAGVEACDPRLAGIVEVLEEEHELMPTHLAIARRVADAWCRPGGARSVLLAGPAEEDKRAIFVHACRALGLRPARIAAHALPLGPTDSEGLARLWARESALAGSALLLDGGGDGAPEVGLAVGAFAERIEGPLVVATRERRHGAARRGMVTLDVEKAPAKEQAAAWRRALGPHALPLGDELESLTAQFSLSSPAIEAVAREVVERCAKGAAARDALWSLCRTDARPRLGDHAQRITPRATWDELVLPPFETELLRDIASHVRARPRVHDAWGFAGRGGRGLSITALFSGGSGTGKTMAAEVIANELKLDLYRIDLSQVVNKYIGETEKNLRRVFDAGEEGGAILLFDEADALFGKRSEVKDSHDRYANIEVSYLLQRMEAYRGLAILTTNLKEALDPAFLRRIRFSVHFPFPTAEQRARIWRKVFPEETPRGPLRYEELARLNVAGGNIRNIAVYAAFLAADAGSPVTMKHLLRAAKVEYAKLERALPDGEVRGWV